MSDSEIYELKSKFETYLYKMHPGTNWNFRWNSKELRYESSEVGWMFFCFRLGRHSVFEEQNVGKKDE